MSKCSKKCNEIKSKIDSISGLDDETVYDWLKRLDNVTTAITDIIDDYSNRNELNGTCFKENNKNKYRKLPVEVEAIQWNGINLQDIINFVGKKLKYEIIDTAWEVGKGKPYIDMKIITLEGNMNVSIGDYIIKGVERRNLSL